MIYIDPTGHFAFLLIPLAPMVAPALTGLGTLGMGIWVNHELNKDKVVQQPKVEQKSTVIHQPVVVQQKPVVNQQPIVQQKATVSQQPIVQQKTTVVQQPAINSNISDGYYLSRGGTARVGRWMSVGEYNKMISTGMAQESNSGTTHVAFPNNSEAFQKQAAPGSLYVEFDVPAASLKVTGEGWAKIMGPNSLEGRYAISKGHPVPQMPNATNIAIRVRK